MRKTLVCDKCGNESSLPEGRDFGFCGHCGNKITDTGNGTAPNVQENAESSFVPNDNAAPEITTDKKATPPINNTIQLPKPSAASTGQNFVSQQYRSMPAKKKPTKAIVAVLAAIAVIIAAVIGISAFGGSPYAKAESNFFSTIFKNVPNAKNDYKVDFLLDYVPSSFIRRNVGMTDTALSGTITYNSEKALAQTVLTSGGLPIISFNAAFDAMGAALSMPELTEYTLMFIAAGSDGATSGIKPPNQDKLNASLSNIGKAYFTHTKDVTTVEKGVRLRSDNLEVVCDEYTIVFTESIAAKIGLAVIDELQKNDDLLAFAKSYVSAMGLEPSDFDQMLLDAQTELSSITGDTRLFRMAVWVKDGKIIARRIDNVLGINLRASYMFLSNSNNANFSTELSVEGIEFNLNGSFTKNKNAWDGEINLTAKGGYSSSEALSLKAVCTGMSKSGKYMTGNVVMNGFVDDAMLSLDLELGKTGNNQTIVLSGSADVYGEKVDFGKLTLSYARSNGGKINIPVLDPDLCVIANDYSPDNASRAEVMSDQLYEHLYSSDYDNNELVSELIYLLWSMVDDIVWYSDYGYGYDFSGYNDDYFDDFFSAEIGF